MAAPQLSSSAEQERRSGSRSVGRAVPVLVLAMTVLLLGWTNYTALTNDSFRDWAAGYLPSGFASAASLVEDQDDSRVIEAMTREAALTAKINILQGSVAALTIDAAALRNANANLIARERATSAKLVIAEKHRLAGVAAAQRMGSRMKARAVKSVARQLATLPGKVLPAVGATVVVGSTVLELRDLCDGMQDMAALNVAVGLPTIDERDICGVRIGSVETIVANAKRNMAVTYATAMQAAGVGTSPAPVSARFPPGTPASSLPEGQAR